MCEMQRYLPPSFFNAQEHYLIHLVKENEICGSIHTKSIWLVERHLKELEAFIRLTLHSEDSMVESYMVYNPWCILVIIYPKRWVRLMYLSFGMSIPPTNLKGRCCWRKVYG
jgi:hypothetical protein